jgi:membrane-bound lytic murein transglycosylase A
MRSALADPSSDHKISLFRTAKFIRWQARRSAMSRLGGSSAFEIGRDRIVIAAAFVVVMGIVAQVIGLSAHAASPAERQSQLAAFPPAIFGPSTAQPEPLRLRDTAIEPIEWADLKGWSADDHVAAWVTFVASCRPLLRTSLSGDKRLTHAVLSGEKRPRYAALGGDKRPIHAALGGEKRPMYAALMDVCRRALAVGRLTDDQARVFFERNFRPVHITRLGDNTGLLTGYYEPIVDGSRFPTGIFKVPIYRRPPDLVPPPHSAGSGFPNRGQSLRRTDSGTMVPYYDRGEILDGALDGKHLEICWIKNQSDALTIQIQGSARVRLEDGAMLRINYDGHNGYPFMSLSRILLERNVISREEMSFERVREWIRANPQSTEELLRQNRSFMFFRIVGLSEDRRPAELKEPPPEREAIGAQGISLTPGRSVAIDNALHVYGTPFFIEADLPLAEERRGTRFAHLMIAQDTGSAIVGPARADIFWGAGDRAGQVASHIHHPGNFAMLVPRELDPVHAGARMPLPPQKPAPPAEAKANSKASLKASLQASPNVNRCRARPTRTALPRPAAAPPLSYPCL